MTPDAFRQAIATLGFAGSTDFASWIDTSDRAVRRWLNEGDGPPGSVAKLVLLMLAEDYRPSDVDRTIRAYRKDAIQ